MGAALAMWVMNFGDRLHAEQAPARPVRARPARAVLARQQDQPRRWCSSSPPSRSRGRRSRTRSRTRSEAKRAYSFVLTYLMFIAAWAAVGAEPVRAVDRALPRAQARLLAGRGGDPGARVRERLLRRLHRRHDRHRPHAPDAVQLDRRDGSGAIFNFGLNLWLHPGLRDARRGLRDPGRVRILIMVVRTWNAQQDLPRRVPVAAGRDRPRRRRRCSPRSAKAFPHSLAARVRPDARRIRSCSRPSASTSRPSGSGSGDCFRRITRLAADVWEGAPPSSRKSAG